MCTLIQLLQILNHLNHQLRRQALKYQQIMNPKDLGNTEL